MLRYYLDKLSANYTRVDYAPVPVDIYREGNCGIPYVWTYTSAVPGPHVMVCGIMHGNEIAGAAVLDKLLQEGIRPQRGSLTLCFGNPEAYGQFDRTKPYLGRLIDIDINRVWGKELDDPDRKEHEVLRARALRPIVESVDILLDVHSMQPIGPPLVTVKNDRDEEVARTMTEIPFIMSGQQPNPELTRLREFGKFGDPDESAVGLQIQAGQHWRKETISTALRITRQFLQFYCGIPSGQTDPTQPQKRLHCLEVLKQQSTNFSFGDDFENATYFPEAGALIGSEGARDIRTSIDDCYLMMPVHFRRSGGPIGRIAVELTHPALSSSN